MPLRKLPDVTNVAAGQTATIRVPVGPTYDKIVLDLSAATNFALSSFTNLRVLLDGKVVQEFASAQVLDDINTYHGRVAASAVTPSRVTLHFRRQEAQSLSGVLDRNSNPLTATAAERITSLRTGNLKTVSIEVTCGGTMTVPAISAYAEEVFAPKEAIGLITKIRKYTYNPGGAGDFEISDWPRGPRLIAAHFNKADVNVLTVKTDSYAVIDNVTKTVLQRLQTEDGRVPVAGYTVADFCKSGDLGEALKTADLQDLRATLSLGSGGAFSVVLEYLDTFDGL